MMSKKKPVKKAPKKKVMPQVSVYKNGGKKKGKMC